MLEIKNAHCDDTKKSSIDEEWRLWKKTETTPFGNKNAKPYIILWEISNRGRARRNGVISKGIYDRGYIYVGGHSLHRLVAELFIPRIANKNCVDHINGIRDDNRVENLRWCTHKENSSFELARKHISESKKGKNLGDKNPNFNHRWSLEQRMRMSINRKELCKDGKIGEKISKSKKGLKRVYDKNGKYHYEH